MVCTARGRVILAALAILTGVGRGLAQPLPARPVAVASPQAVSEIPGPPVPPPELTTAPPAAGPFGATCGLPGCPYEDCNGRLLKGDPLLDPPFGGALGWFGDVEVTVVGPHIKNRVTNAIDLGLGAGPQIIHLPTAELDWTAAPRFEAGYRFGQGFGEVLLSYRFLTTDGSATLAGFDGDGALLHSRLNLNVADLDYGSREFSLGPQVDMKWRVGVRVANLFFDSRAVGPFLEERTSDSFIGAGPHAVLDLGWRSPDMPEFALYSRLEGAVGLGKIRENFEQTISAFGVPLVGGALNTKEDQTVPMLHIQAGFSYTPDWADRQLRFVTGYDFESWWALGPRGNNHSAFTGNGVFVRAEFNY
jgi:hypothetical protein